MRAAWGMRWVARSVALRTLAQLLSAMSDSNETTTRHERALRRRRRRPVPGAATHDCVKKRLAADESQIELSPPKSDIRRLQ
jgi:hypothetical protein